MIKGNYIGIPIMSLVILSLACSQLSPKSSRLYPSGKIVYQSDQSGNFELYSIDIRGGTTLQLTKNSANDVSPTYISAVNQIGFASDQNNGWNLYVMDTFGKNMKRIISDDNIAVDYPDWSADGNFIVASLVENCVAPAMKCIYDIYVMDADGTNLKNLTNTSASEWVPDWSPDGQKIAFSSDRDGDSEIYIMNKDGSNLDQITNNRGYDGRPRWSPDGTKLAFETDRDGGDWDIYIMDSDGSNPLPITSNTTSEFSESWSPDGNWLVYVSNSDGDNEIFIIDVNGQNQLRLTNNNNNDTAPIWLP
jgi:Tol biopolymer transport system component